MKAGLPPARARVLFAEIVSAVAYCHAHDVAHRDLKPDNILLSEEGSAKVADFGLSQMEAARAGEAVGTPLYAAPEVLFPGRYAGTDAAGCSGKAADVWSTGVILYEMFVGHLPYNAPDVARMEAAIFERDLAFPPGAPPPLVALVMRMLDPNPATRIPSDDIMDNTWLSQRGVLPHLSMDFSSHDAIELEGEAATPVGAGAPAGTPGAALAASGASGDRGMYNRIGGGGDNSSSGGGAGGGGTDGVGGGGGAVPEHPRVLSGSIERKPRSYRGRPLASTASSESPLQIAVPDVADVGTLDRPVRHTRRDVDLEATTPGRPRTTRSRSTTDKTAADAASLGATPTRHGRGTPTGGPGGLSGSVSVRGRRSPVGVPFGETLALVSPATSAKHGKERSGTDGEVRARCSGVVVLTLRRARSTSCRPFEWSPGASTHRAHSQLCVAVVGVQNVILVGSQVLRAVLQVLT